MTSANDDVRELEYHLSQGNYAFLNQVNKPHTVANYWKRLLREMRNPLIPFELYDAFGELGQMYDEVQKL